METSNRPKFCSQCGNALPSSAVFCPNCGAKIGGSPASAVSQATASAPGTDGGNRQSTNKDVVPYSKFEKYRDIALFSLLCYGVFRGIISMWMDADWETKSGQLSSNIFMTICLSLLVLLCFSIVYRKYFKRGK